MSTRIINRTNRIIGQMNGVKRMIESKNDCSEILQQIVSIRAALAGLGKELIVSERRGCKRKELTVDELESYLDNFFKIT